MISVLPCRDKAKIAELFNKHGLQTDDFSGCVIASTNDEALGYCLYRLDSKKKSRFLPLSPKATYRLPTEYSEALCMLRQNALCLTLIMPTARLLTCLKKSTLLKTGRKNGSILTSFSAVAVVIINSETKNEKIFSVF